MSVLLRGAGPVARGIVEAWLELDREQAPALRWAADPIALRAWLRRSSERAARVTLVDPASEADGACIDARGPTTATIQRSPAGKRESIPPASALAAAAVLAPLDGGPGLRWVSLEVVEGRREGEDPGLGAVDRPGAREALTTALGRSLPNLAGKLAVAVVGCPQLGDSLRICAQLAPGASIDVARDILTDRRDPQLESAPGAGSDEAMGRARVLVDGEAILGVGPLVRVLAHYDPAALTAAAVWRRLLGA